MRAVGLILLLALPACSREAQAPAAPPKPPGDAAFTAVAGEFLEDLYRRQPTQATFLGIHKYDDTLEDYSQQAVRDAVTAARGFRRRVAAIDACVALAVEPARSRAAPARDRFAHPHARSHPPVGQGSRHLQQRHHQHRLPDDQARLRAARRAAAAAHRAREGDARRADGGAQEPRQPAEDFDRRSRSSSWTAARASSRPRWPQAFPEVKDKALLDEFKTANDAVIAALGDYKKWLQDDLLKRSERRLRHRRGHLSRRSSPPTR